MIRTDFYKANVVVNALRVFGYHNELTEEDYEYYMDTTRFSYEEMKELLKYDIQASNIPVRYLNDCYRDRVKKYLIETDSDNYKTIDNTSYYNFNINSLFFEVSIKGYDDFNYFNPLSSENLNREALYSFLDSCFDSEYESEEFELVTDCGTVYQAIVHEDMEIQNGVVSGSVDINAGDETLDFVYVVETDDICFSNHNGTDLPNIAQYDGWDIIYCEAEIAIDEFLEQNGITVHDFQIAA